MGLDEVRIFSAEGHALGVWGIPLERTGDAHAPPMARWVEQALQEQVPQTALWCLEQCRQYTIVPLLVEGVLGGAVALSRSLAEVALNAQRISGSDIGLLVDHPDLGFGTARHLDAWSGTLVILTRESILQPLLEAASRQWPLDRLRATPEQLDWRDGYYELAALPLNVAPGSRAGDLLLVSDVTRQVRAIHQNTRTTLAIALLGWLAAELLLLWILWGPMNRLRRLPQHLPLLARGDFDRVRQAVGPPRRRFADEIDLMASADLAMYQAKDSGPGHWHILPTADQVRAAMQKRVYWVEYLRDTLVEGNFELHAQPLQRLSDGHINHYEILVRMRGPEGDLVPPNRFIPVAEQSRQIVEMDRWVLRESLKLMQILHRKDPDVHLTVNLSAHTLHSANLFGILVEELQRYRINPKRLTLEITETAAVTDFVKVKHDRADSRTRLPLLPGRLWRRI